MTCGGYEIYYDSLTEASWFASLHPDFSITNPANTFSIIGQKGTNPDIIEKIISYDKPDIILVKNGVPLLVLEKTQEVPTGHNVGQRFARLVRAIELGVPTIYYFPFDARKHGKYSNVCNMNARLLLAAQKIYEIHDTPLLCVQWATDDDGEIVTDGTENVVMKKLLKSYVDSDFSNKCDAFMEQLENMKTEYDTRVLKYSAYLNMPDSVEKISTDTLVEMHQIDKDKVDDEFLKRPFTILYKIGMTPKNCKRQDPYTGMTFIYDYILCRNGKNPSDKCCNLVLYFPDIKKSTWQQKNPDNPMTKSCNWYLTANMLLFNDGYDFLR